MKNKMIKNVLFLIGVIGLPFFILGALSILWASFEIFLVSMGLLKSSVNTAVGKWGIIYFTIFLPAPFLLWIKIRNIKAITLSLVTTTLLAFFFNDIGLGIGMIASITYLIIIHNKSIQRTPVKQQRRP